MLKQNLRTEMKEKRRLLSPSFRAEASLSAASHALSLIPPVAKSIALFASMSDEIDTAPLAAQLLARGCTTLYPRTTPERPLDFYPATPDELILSKHPRMALREPTGEQPGATLAFPLHQIDVFIVPGLAFDTSGARLGFGKGYYDRTLPLARPTAIVIGYAFSCQLVGAVPQAPHDQRVHAIVTELGVTQASNGPFLYMAPQNAKEGPVHGL
jgi:5-formyltetrahydrofolate cyclo-ligase